MGSILALCLLGIVAALLAAYLKPTRPDFSNLLILCAGVLLFLACVQWLRPLFDTLAELAGAAGVGEYLSLLLKALGICCITKFASDFCKDAGHAALSAKIDLLGRCAVLVMGMPLISNIVQILTELVK